MVRGQFLIKCLKLRIEVMVRDKREKLYIKNTFEVMDVGISSRMIKEIKNWCSWRIESCSIQKPNHRADKRGVERMVRMTASWERSGHTVGEGSTFTRPEHFWNLHSAALSAPERLLLGSDNIRSCNRM